MMCHRVSDKISINTPQENKYIEISRSRFTKNKQSFFFKQKNKH